jgi:hypothetical protein
LAGFVVRDRTLAKATPHRNRERSEMNTRDGATPTPQGKSPPGWGSWLIVVLVVGAITAAATYAAIRYFTHCGNCTPPPREQSVQIAAGAYA